MEPFENDESDDDSRDSPTSENTDESDISFDDELENGLDELEISSECSTENEMDVDSIGESDMSQSGFTSISSDDVTPTSVFRNFFTEEIFSLIVDQTNIYGKQKKRKNSRTNNNRWEDVIMKDIESFLGIIIVMGINSLPSMKHYWSKDNVFHNGFISSIMSRNRFLQIFYNLHLADNSLEPKSGSTNYSTIYKIKNFVEILLRNFQNNYKFDHYGSIDETMVKFKGRSSLKQYIPTKPVKRGYKIWCLCDSITSYLFNCRIYLGKEGTSDNASLLGERVVSTLIANHRFEGKNLYFDNFFTSLSLLEKLRRQRITATGTIRSDRVGIPPQFALKEKMKRGDHKSVVISNTIIFKWMDTKHVFLATNDCENTGVVTISRRLKDRQLIKIDCPKAIVDYNKFTHGVDKFNQRISSYTFDRKSRRNWLRLFFFFFNASLANSYICYNQLDQNGLPYVDYLVSVARSLCSGARRKNIGRPTSTKTYEYSALTSQSTDQLDSGMHLPVKGTRRRCAKCSTNEMQVRSTIECSNCKLAFCVTDEKNCFYEYHKHFL